MAKLAFYTQTYCAEKHVRRTIESILNQSYKDFVYYISDDGSTDATPEIIMEYASKDERIIPCLSKSNSIMTLYVESINKIWNESGAEYFSILDHDDEYAPDFAEKMITEMERADVDLAICGMSCVDFNTGRQLSKKALDQNILVNKENRGMLFPYIFQFYRTVWGKIYKIDFLKKNNIQFRNTISYGVDTVFCLDCFGLSDRFLMLKDILHTYYMHDSSISRRYDPKRSEDDSMLYQEGINYLNYTQGLSSANLSFMLSVYLCAVIDNVHLICKAKLRPGQVVDNLHKLLTGEKYLDNWRTCQILCDGLLNKESILMQTKKNIEKQVFLLLKSQILTDSKYKYKIFDTACVFCPELNDFFDANNIKSFLALDAICDTFLSRDFQGTYNLINQSYGENCFSANKLVYYLKVYLSAILDKDSTLAGEYVEQNQRKTDDLTQKRLNFLSECEEAIQELPMDSVQSFNELMEFIDSHSEEDLLMSGFQVFLKRNKISAADAAKRQDLLYRYFMENSFTGVFKSQFVGGGRLIDTISHIKQHTKEYKWLYEILEDEQSQKTLFYILMYRIFLDETYLSLSETEEIQYFDSKIIPRRENHVFVDCGAFTGDSATDFIKYCAPDENYKRIYCYEPAPDNYCQVLEAMNGYHDVVCMNKGVFDENSQMRFTSNMPNAANRINPAGDKVVEIVDIDSDIREPVSFIKMDIESAEPNALLGARRHITEDKPILAICVYHTVTDLLKIPQIIYEMNNNQKFYLRHHGHNTPEEIVFYALPNEERFESEKSDTLLLQIEQLAELYDTIGEGITYVGEKIKQGNLEEAYKMMPLIQEGLERESSFIQFMQRTQK